MNLTDWLYDSSTLPLTIATLLRSYFLLLRILRPIPMPKHVVIVLHPVSALTARRLMVYERKRKG